MIIFEKLTFGRKQLLGITKDVHNVGASAAVVVRMLRKKLGGDGDGLLYPISHGYIGTIE